MKIFWKTFFVSILFIFIFGSNSQAVVEEIINEYYAINLDKETIARGYTVSAFDEEIKLSLTPGILSAATAVELVKLNEGMPSPWKLDQVGHIYQYEFKNKVAYDDHKPFYIQMSYQEDDNRFKQVFFFDGNYNTWRPLPTVDYQKEKFVRSLIHLPFARLAIFSYPETLGSGRASWYAFKNGNFSASPDFPRGSRLRVHNLANNKFVDVEINDYGPDRAIHPDRAIDLDRVAFEKIASLRDGIIDVRIEVLHVPTDENGKKLGIGDKGIGEEPDVLAGSVFIYDEDSGEEIWSKNASETRPLASLTKLLAMKVFLDTKPNLDDRVAYSIKDEEYNYQYCNRWEVARLVLKEGEEMTKRDLLYVSLIGSTNNTVETLVRASGLKRADFISQMNKFAHSIGAGTANFVEPSGLSADNVSSASDFALLAKEILQDDFLAKISATKEYEINIYQTDSQRKRNIKNTNPLIREGLFGITGSKTGFLNKAGYCLINRIKKDQGGSLLVVLLGSDKRADSFNESRDLIRYALKQTN